MPTLAWLVYMLEKARGPRLNTRESSGQKAGSPTNCTLARSIFEVFPLPRKPEPTRPLSLSPSPQPLIIGGLEGREGGLGVYSSSFVPVLRVSTFLRRVV